VDDSPPRRSVWRLGVLDGLVQPTPLGKRLGERALDKADWITGAPKRS
jgi:hypothetical protein